MNNCSDKIKKILTPGTPVCSVIYAAAGVIIAVLLLTIGVWKTLFIFAFAALGALIGGVGNKQEAVRAAVNRRFPERDLPIREIAPEKNDVAEMAEKIVKAETAEETAETADTEEKE